MVLEIPARGGFKVYADAQERIVLEQADQKLILYLDDAGDVDLLIKHLYAVKAEIWASRHARSQVKCEAAVAASKADVRVNPEVGAQALPRRPKGRRPPGSKNKVKADPSHL